MQIKQKMITRMKFKPTATAVVIVYTTILSVFERKQYEFVSKIAEEFPALKQPALYKKSQHIYKRMLK